MCDCMDLRHRLLCVTTTQLEGADVEILKLIYYIGFRTIKRHIYVVRNVLHSYEWDPGTRILAHVGSIHKCSTSRKLKSA